MQKDKCLTIAELVRLVREFPDASFYRERYGEGNLLISETGSYEGKSGELPLISAQDILETPLENRLYDKKVKAGKFAKIVQDYCKPFLVQRNIQELVFEFYGTLTDRTQILYLNSNDAIEKCMWAYCHGRLPFIGEGKNLDVSAYAAKKLGIDRLLTDSATLEAYLPYLKKHQVQNVAITLTGDYFPPNIMNLLSLDPDTTEIILQMPETGALAHACPAALAQGKILFHPLPDCVLETAGNLIVTKKQLLPTPIIRYRTDTFAERSVSPEGCICKNSESFCLL
jgi:hypothetical protein